MYFLHDYNPNQSTKYILYHHNQNQSIKYIKHIFVSSARTAMYEIIEFLMTFSEKPATSWHMRNALGRIVGGGEFGTFTSECVQIIKEQHSATPLMIIFDNGLYTEIINEDDE